MTTDEGGVAVLKIAAGPGNQTLDVDARDTEGNRAASSIPLQLREGSDQILLRTERAVYKAGDRIQLKIVSTRKKRHCLCGCMKDGR